MSAVSLDDHRPRRRVGRAGPGRRADALPPPRMRRHPAAVGIWPLSTRAWPRGGHDRRAASAGALLRLRSHPGPAAGRVAATPGGLHRGDRHPVAIPIRTGNCSARCAATAASTAYLGEANAAHTPSPVCLNMKPPCASIAERNTSSCAASATRIPSASFSHRRVEPSTSVNRNVTSPEGAAAGSADTPAESHNRCAPTSHIGGSGRRHPRPEARRSAVHVGRIPASIWHMLAGQR